MKLFLPAMVLSVASFAGCESSPQGHSAIGPTGVVCEAVHTFRQDRSTHPGRTITVVYMSCGDCSPATTGFFGLGAKEHVCGPACSGPDYICPVCTEHPYAAVGAATK